MTATPTAWTGLCTGCGHSVLECLRSAPWPYCCPTCSHTLDQLRVRVAAGEANREEPTTMHHPRHAAPHAANRRTLRRTLALCVVSAALAVTALTLPDDADAREPVQTWRTGIQARPTTPAVGKPRGVQVRTWRLGTTHRQLGLPGGPRGVQVTR